MPIKFRLTAKSSLQDIDLWVSKEDQEIYLTLTGKYEEKAIQVDFDVLGEEDIQELIYFLSYNLNKKRVFENE